MLMEGDWAFGGEHTCNIQMLYYTSVHLKHVMGLTNFTLVNLSVKKKTYLKLK